MRTIFWLLLFTFLLIVACSTNTFTPSEECAGDSKCLIRKAVLETKPELCEKIADSSDRDACYLQLVAWNNDATYCGKVQLRNNVEGCYFFAAVQSNNLGLCDKLNDVSGLLYTKIGCKNVATIKNTKPNLRNESLLSDGEILNVVFITNDAQDAKMIEEFDKIQTK